MADRPLQEKARKALKSIQRCIELFGIEHVSFSFNGGKDSTVLLHLLHMATSHATNTSRADDDQVPKKSFRSFYFVNSDDFEEVESFVRRMDVQYSLEVEYVEFKDFKEGLRDLVNSGTKAIILGTRRGDPNAANQDVYCPSSEGWPVFMRVNPIMDWSYSDVWGFLKACQLPYCHLYDQGYTSLGSRSNTLRNQALLLEDGNYAPAHMLPDGRLERAGRASSSLKPPPPPTPVQATVSSAKTLLSEAQHPRMSSEMDRVLEALPHVSSGSAFSLTAAIVIIGDEILSGKVEDCNLSFLSSELREIGWVVTRAAFVLDDPDAIAAELGRLSSSAEIVLSCGGIGPTLDDVTMDGVARYLGKKLSRHQGLEARIRGFFGDSISDAHLKMADLPDGEVELLDYRLPPAAGADGEGELSKWPIIKTRNVYVLPGVPLLLRQKWQAIKGFLLGSSRVRPFKSLTFRLSISDETRIATALDRVSSELGKNLRIGSYPVTMQDDGCQIVLTLEGKDKDLVEAGATKLKNLLPADCCLSIEEDLRTFLARSISVVPSR